MDTNEVKNASRRSMKWSFLGEIFAKIATPLSTMFLARILSPEIYGIATAVTIIMTFCETVLENGFAKYIIQRDFKDEDEYKKSFSILFWFSLATSILTCAIIFFLRFPLSEIIGNQGYELVLGVASIQIPFATISALLASAMKREFKFNRLFIVRLFYCLIPFAVTIPLALFKFNYWSLVIGSIAAQVVQLFILLFISKAKISFYFSFRQLGVILKTALPMIVESVIIWLCAWTSTLLATQFFDREVVGLVKVSNSTVTSVFGLFSASFTSVLFPTLSRLKNNKEEFEDSFYSIQQLAFCLLLPLGLGCFFYSDLITQVLLGSGWLEASFMIGIFALTKPLNLCFNNFLSEVFRSKGNFYYSVFYQLFMLAVDITLRITIGRLSLQNYILVNIIIDLIINTVAVLILKIKYKFSIKKQIRAIVPAVLCSLAMVPFIQSSNEFFSTSYFTNAIQIAVCIVVYFSVFFIFFPVQFKSLLQFFKIEKLKISRIKNSKFIRKAINRENPKFSKKKLISTCLLVVATSLIFVGGAFDVNSTIEYSANCLSQISSENNSDVYITCEPTDKESFKATRASTELFSKSFNDQFYETKPFKCVLFSEDESSSYYIEELDNLGTDIAILPSSFFSNHEDSNGIIFDLYYAKLMFEDSNTDRMSGKYENFVYITKSQADLLLSKYDLNNYKDLIDTEVTFYYGDNYESWKIANIFDDSVFIDKANAAFDNFVVCGYYYLPGEIKDKEKVLFAFDDSDFFNQIELKAIINNFSKDSFNFNFFNQILTIDQNVSSKVINLLNGRSNSVQGLFIALVSTGSILFLASCIFLLLLRKIKIEYFIFDILVLMSCWVLFKILSSFTFFEFTFSFTSLSIFLIFAMVVLIISLFLLLRSYFGRESNE